MPLTLIGFGTAAMVAGLALVVLAPRTVRAEYAVPAVKTVALVTAAAAAVAALFHL
ncbi:hypothetical protein [Streptomyces sp. CB03234]|uniref:hypothetical protein n=1 Tax=Streptomyces sp. (strain CB03234) TaxID=1703937 RepID=UPI0013011F45|nr:hypothetical protein [Streptomyces sp. CB03234]